jgi:hypothetical protein
MLQRRRERGLNDNAGQEEDENKKVECPDTLQKNSFIQISGCVM